MTSTPRSAPNGLRQASLIRQLYSRRQLYEVMVEFWSDHFHISVEKGDCFYLKTVDDRAVIRPHALGAFGDLLWASAHSPAMLVYLDNQSNQKGTPNENYAPRSDGTVHGGPGRWLQPDRCDGTGALFHRLGSQGAFLVGGLCLQAQSCTTRGARWSWDG